MDRFNKKIDEQIIRDITKNDLHNIVEHFFSVDYHNISEKRMLEIKDDFQIRRLEIVCTIFDKKEVEEISNQIQNCLFTLLDQSVDKSNPEKVETEYKLGVSTPDNSPVKFEAYYREKKSK